MPRLAALIALLTTGSLCAVCVPSSALADDSCDLPSGVLSMDELPEGSSAEDCDAVGRLVEGPSNIVLAVPAPGEGIRMEGFGLAGSMEFEIDTTVDGNVEYELHEIQGASGDEWVAGPPDVDESIESSGATGACQDATYGILPGIHVSGFSWRLGDGRRPTSMTSSEVLSALSSATINLTNQQTNCSAYASDQVSATASYQGTTTRESQFITNANGYTTCAGSADGDGVSVTDFGSINAEGRDLIAGHCQWLSLGVVVEHDIRFDSPDHSFVDEFASICLPGTYDLESVATHEFGHALGLKDITGASHGYLTMYYRPLVCSLRARTLGKGDILGLRSLY